MNLSASPASGPAPLRVRFESRAGGTGGGDFSYVWRLGNRTFGGGANRSYTFVRAGTFRVSVAVSDGVLTVSDTVTVRVGGGSGTSRATARLRSLWARRRPPALKT